MVDILRILTKLDLIFFVSAAVMCVVLASGDMQSNILITVKFA